MTGNIELFNHILSQVQHIGEIKRNVSGKEYTINKRSRIFTFATNIMMVLEGKRTAYRADICDHKINRYMIDCVLERRKDLIELHVVKEEPLLLLRSNVDTVYDILKNETDFHVGLGKILEYAYTGSDWMNIDETHHLIDFVIENNESTGHLYSFTVPKGKLNEDVMSKILEDEKKYSDVLTKYGITVKVEIDNNL